MGVQKTDVNTLAKVTSLGARFFEKFVTSTKMNKVISNMNDVGLCDLIIATNVSQTVDFGSLKVGDHIVIILPAAETILLVITVPGKTKYVIVTN